MTDDSDHVDAALPGPGLPSVFDAPAGRSRRRRWDVALVIAAGGAIGGGARWTVNEAWPPTPGRFPWATFIENVSGCLILGALMVFLLDVWRPHRYARPFLGIGVLGGFTTFSTYTADTRALLLDSQVPLALVYLFGTLIVAMAATWTGVVVARSAAGITSRPR